MSALRAKGAGWSGRPATGSLVLACLLMCVVVGGALSGCFRDVIRVQLPGNYVLIAVDSAEQLHVGWDAEQGFRTVVPAVVVQAGWNDHYIVAANRTEGISGGPLSYYYIDLNYRPESGAFADRGVAGPFTEAEFLKAKNDLGLPEFTLRYPKLR